MDNYKETVEEESIDIKSLIYKFLSKWYWFVGFLAVSFVIAYFTNKWSQPVYEVRTSVLIKEEQSVLDSRFSAGLGINNTQYKISNEIGILKSYQITQRALNTLDFGIDYFLENRFFASDLYKSSPIEIIVDTTISQPVNVKFQLTFLSADEFKLSINTEYAGKYDFKQKKITGNCNQLQFENKYKLFEKISTADFAFTVIPRNPDRSQFIGKKLCFVFNTPEALIRQFRNFSVSTDKSSSIITISMKGYNVPKW